MKLLRILIFTLVSINCFASSVTITKKQLIGEWVSHYGYSTNSHANTRSNDLKITNDFNVTLIRSLESGNKQIFHASPSDMEISDDIYIFSFPAKDSLSYKLVLSGWVNGDTKLLFGMLYLYDNGELFNGISVSFKPKAVNKSSNLTGAENAPLS
jgi:hypothetical protein